ERVSYRQLLEVFFATHDPTTLNRQGADVGTQYRSAIFVHTPEQRREAVEMIANLVSIVAPPAVIVTEVVDAAEFFPAESYHQGYFAANPAQGYCTVVITPKVAAFRRKFAGLLTDPE
ncbi:MAG: peptide-methionine (S)-S-oxide reductase, partial [Dechloromonas sp.]|nr:peptide-methionine (S)-S-oxide reductase [Dechloromonas sp.]